VKAYGCDALRALHIERRRRIARCDISLRRGTMLPPPICAQPNHAPLAVRRQMVSDARSIALCCAAFVAAQLLPVSARAADAFDNALVDAQARHAPVLVDFTAPWCYSCYFMVQNVLTGFRVGVGRQARRRDRDGCRYSGGGGPHAGVAGQGAAELSGVR